MQQEVITGVLEEDVTDTARHLDKQTRPDARLEVDVVGVPEPAPVPVTPSPHPVRRLPLLPPPLQILQGEALHLLRSLIRDNPDGELPNDLRKH